MRLKHNNSKQLMRLFEQYNFTVAWQWKVKMEFKIIEKVIYKNGSYNFKMLFA